MEIVQKMRSNKHTFRFEDDYFNFAYEDKTGSGDADMKYANFPNKPIVKIEQNEWLKNVGYIWCAIGVFQLGYAMYLEASLTGKGFWLMVGVICLVWAYFSTVKYSVYQADEGNIFIIQDKKHDEIVNELNNRKRKQLLDWYGEVNPENNLESEIEKFKWLVDQNVISKEESEKKIAQAELIHNDNPDNSGERLN